MSTYRFEFDGLSFEKEVDPYRASPPFRGTVMRDAAESLVRQYGKRVPYGEEQTTEVTVLALSIREGSVVASHHQIIKVATPTDHMTDEAFSREMESLLGEIPNEFHEFVRAKSWEDGHAHGLEEVIVHARDLVGGLAPAVRRFVASITATNTPGV